MLFLSLLAAVAGLLVIAAIVRPHLIYEYPYFMAATFAAFIIPQAYALVRIEWAPGAVRVMLLVALLCIAACWCGYQLPARPTLIEKLNVPVNPGRLFHAGIVFVIVGLIFNHLIERLPEDEKASAWTGRLTLYAFFGQLIYPGFAICFYSAIRQRNILAWICALIAAAIPLELAIVYARREPTALFLLSIGLSLFFLKSKAPPRWVILGVVIGTMFAIPATGEYRSTAAEDPLRAIREINFVEQLQQYFEEDAISEVKNASIVIAATQGTGDYEMGAGYWNRIVFRFVPAQLLGEGFKNSLMIGGEQRDLSDFIEESVGFKLPSGTTVTGLGDSFNQFGYFGCLVFAAIAFLFKNLWVAANHSGSPVVQILYIQSSTSAMRALTHQTMDFLPGFIYGAIFIGLVALYAQERYEPAPTFRHGHMPRESTRK